MTTLYLHIGHSKTGTTAQQAWLTSNHDWLKKRGIHYIASDDLGVKGGHREFAKGFVDKPLPGVTPPMHTSATQQKLARELKQVKVPNILMSSESFLLANAGRVRDYFRDVLPDIKTKVIFFVRSQDELAESQYNQLVKLNREEASGMQFTRFAKAFQDMFDFYLHARRWEDAFGANSILASVFDARSDTAIDQLLSKLPLVPDEIAGAPPAKLDANARNRSLKMKSLSVIRILNTISVDNRFGLYRRIARQLDMHSPPALLYDSVWGKRYRERFSRSNEDFSARYLDQSAADLGGRRYTDEERDEIRVKIRLALKP